MLSKRVILFIVVVTILLGLPRFAHQKPDSQYYLEVSRYVAGDGVAGPLKAPFAFRFIVPWLAAQGPTGNLRLNWGILNILVTMAAYLLVALFIYRLGAAPGEQRSAVLLLLLSFPSLNYSSGILTDPGGLLILAAGALLLQRQRYLWLAILAGLGVAVRESALLLAAAALIHLWHGSSPPKNRHRLAWSLITAVPPLAAFFLIRHALFDIPGYLPLPSMAQLLRNIGSPIGWATLLLTLAPPLILAGSGLLKGGADGLKEFPMPQRRLLLALGIPLLMLLLYSMTAAAMSGRFAWPLYMVLLPLAVRLGRESRLYKRILLPLADRLLSS
jgi:hypothetical protein